MNPAPDHVARYRWVHTTSGCHAAPDRSNRVNTSSNNPHPDGGAHEFLGPAGGPEDEPAGRRTHQRSVSGRSSQRGLRADTPVAQLHQSAAKTSAHQRTTNRPRLSAATPHRQRSRLAGLPGSARRAPPARSPDLRIRLIDGQHPYARTQAPPPVPCSHRYRAAEQRVDIVRNHIIIRYATPAHRCNPQCPARITQRYAHQASPVRPRPSPRRSRPALHLVHGPYPRRRGLLQHDLAGENHQPRITEDRAGASNQPAQRRWHLGDMTQDCRRGPPGGFCEGNERFVSGESVHPSQVSRGP